MKFLDKLGLALFSIIVLVLSIVLCLIAFGWMEYTIFDVLIRNVLISQTYTYIMVGVCVFLILLAIRCIFFSEPKELEESDNGILLQNEDGRLLITVETLKNMVEGVINGFSDITDSATSVIITKENEIVINITIDVSKETIIKDVSSKLQIKVKKVVKEATDLDIESVNVRVRNVEEIMANTVEEEKEEKEEIKIVKENEEEKTKPKAKQTKAAPKKQSTTQTKKKVVTKNKSK